MQDHVADLLVDGHAHRLYTVIALISAVLLASTLASRKSARPASGASWTPKLYSIAGSELTRRHTGSRHARLRVLDQESETFRHRMGRSEHVAITASATEEIVPFAKQLAAMLSVHAAGLDEV